MRLAALGAYQLKLAEVIGTKLLVLDISMVGNNLGLGVELPNSLSSHLHRALCHRVSRKFRYLPHKCFALPHMVFTKQELPVKVRNVNCIQVNHLNGQKSGAHESLEHFTACTNTSNISGQNTDTILRTNSPGTNNKHASFVDCIQHSIPLQNNVITIMSVRWQATNPRIAGAGRHRQQPSWPRRSVQPSKQ